MADERRDERPIGAHAKHFAEPAEPDRAVVDKSSAQGHTELTSSTPKKSKRNKVLIAIIIVCLAVAAGAGGYVWHMNQLEQQRAQEMSKSDKPATKVKKTGKSLPANPIDFASLVQENSDIYAWLYIPGADINTPLLQSQADDLFYLEHDKDSEEYKQYKALADDVANKINAIPDEITTANAAEYEKAVRVARNALDSLD